MKGKYKFGEIPEGQTATIFISGDEDISKLCEEAIRLTEFTRRVIILVKRDSIYAPEHLQKAVLENPFISVLPFTEVVGLKGDPATDSLKAITIRDVRFGSRLMRDIPTQALYNAT